MEINANGVTASTLESKLAEWTTQLRSVYGNDFVIKKESAISNLAAGVCGTTLDAESVLLFLIKNMNPYTAEGIWQDFLYSLIGLTRTQATFTVAQRTINGTAGSVISAGSLIFKNASTDDQFVLMSDVTIGSAGTVVGSFKAIEMGAIQLDSSVTCSIVSSPTTVSGVYYTSGNVTTVGQDYESDAEFRERWLQEQSLVVANTEGGIKKALLPYCNNISENVVVRMNRNSQTYNDVPLHSMNIVVYSAYDNATIADVIFKKLIDGVGLSGSISVSVTDSEGNAETILFSRATTVRTYFDVDVVLKSGYTLDTGMQNSIKNAIKNNMVLNMGTDVVANKAVRYIDEVEGVDYVSAIKVSTNNSTWTDTVTISNIQVATLAVGDINVSI